MATATFYHAGCAVCVDADQRFVRALDSRRYEVETVHPGEDATRLAEAKTGGVRSLPTLVIDGAVYHINHDADLPALEAL